jgi:hypothetical protein
MVKVALLSSETVGLEQDERGVVLEVGRRGGIGKVGGDTQGLTPDTGVVVGGV